MKRSGIPTAILIAMTAILLSAPGLSPANPISEAAGRQLNTQVLWTLRIPLAKDDSIVRTAVLDDNIYALTHSNKVFALHAGTGVVRWSAQVAEPGQTVRGPTHTAQYALFTTPGGVRIFDRRTGELASEPRTLDGVIIEVAHDTATISIGRVHGVRSGDIFSVRRKTSTGDLSEDALGQMRVTVVQETRARGVLSNYDKLSKPQSGDHVYAKVELPLKEVRLPFAASSAAAADDTWLYVGAANQRLYSIGIFGGFQHWQVLTPNTMSTTPILVEEDVIFADRSGRVASCTKELEAPTRMPKTNWVFQTEGPIFADLAVTADYVYAASTDRSLYCIDRKTGRRVWRERFDTPLSDPPAVVGGLVLQQVPQQGLVALDAATGQTRWRFPSPAVFLVQVDKDLYLSTGEDGRGLIRLNAETGDRKAEVPFSAPTAAVGSEKDQSIILTNRFGQVTCLRPSNAPRLKPAELAEVLRNDRRAKLLKEADDARLAAAQKSEPAAAKAEKKLDFDQLIEDLFRSPRKGRPEEPRPTEPARERKPADEEDEADLGEEDAEAGEDMDDDEAAGEEEAADTEETEEDGDQTEDDEDAEDEEDAESDEDEGSDTEEEEDSDSDEDDEE